MAGTDIDSMNMPMPEPSTATPVAPQSTLLLPRVSIIVVNTNELHHLKRCLPSLARQNYPDYEVIVVDNVSSDGSLEYIAETFPWVRVVRNRANLGYAGANNVGLQHASGDYFAVLNPDTEVEAGWLQALIQTLEQHPQAGMATPKILLLENRERLNTCGNNVSLTGLTFCRGLDESGDRYNQLERIAAVSGAAFVMRRQVWEQIGGFDENFFIYFEETDLSLRASLAGYDVLYVPDARIYHLYRFKFSARKCFYQERNRYLALLKTLRWRTLLVMLPLLLLSEVIAWGYAALHTPAHLRGKLASYGWLIGNWWYVLQVRRRTQALRRVDDHVLLVRFSTELNFTRTTNPFLGRLLHAMVNPIVGLLGQWVRTVVTW